MFCIPYSILPFCLTAVHSASYVVRVAVSACMHGRRRMHCQITFHSSKDRMDNQVGGTLPILSVIVFLQIYQNNKLCLQ